jgi:multisubunit Na+/H+ antiporter MnhG subunit
MFVAGTMMLLAGLIPVVVALISGWRAVSGVSVLTVFAPVGAVLMALARSKASKEWSQKR